MRNNIELKKAYLPYIVFAVFVIISLGIFFCNKLAFDRYIDSKKNDYYIKDISEQRERNYLTIMDENWIGIYSNNIAKIQILTNDISSEVCIPATIQNLRIGQIERIDFKRYDNITKIFIPSNNYEYIGYDSKEIYSKDSSLVFLSTNPENYTNGFYSKINPYVDLELSIYVPEGYVSIFKEKYSNIEGLPNFLSANVSYLYNYSGAPNNGYAWVDYVEQGCAISTLPQAPQRDGFVFTGWYLDKDCTISIELDNYILLNDKLIIYAGWHIE